MLIDLPGATRSSPPLWPCQWHVKVAGRLFRPAWSLELGELSNQLPVASGQLMIYAPILTGDSRQRNGRGCVFGNESVFGIADFSLLLPAFNYYLAQFVAFAFFFFTATATPPQTRRYIKIYIDIHLDIRAVHFALSCE